MMLVAQLKSGVARIALAAFGLFAIVCLGGPARLRPGSNGDDVTWGGLRQRRQRHRERASSQPAPSVRTARAAAEARFSTPNLA